MKKLYAIAMSVLMSFALLACTKNNQESEVKEEPVQEIKVYCAKCAAESNELTKVCESCNEETTWAVEKPEIQEEVEEEVYTDTSDNYDNETYTNDEKMGVCRICGKSDSMENLEHLHGIGYMVHIECHEAYPKCENCGNNLFEFESDIPGICFACGN